MLGAFVAGAVVRASLGRQINEAISARFDGLRSAFLVPIFFVTSGLRLDAASPFSDPIALGMVAVFASLMLAASGVPPLLLYRSGLSRNYRIALALHCGTQLSVVVAITSVAVHRRLMPGVQGAALVGGGILTVLLFPALARPFLRKQPVSPAPPETR